MSKLNAPTKRIKKERSKPPTLGTIRDEDETNIKLIRSGFGEARDVYGSQKLTPRPSRGEGALH